MKSRNTIIWFILAVVLTAAIWISNKYLQPSSTGENPLLAGLRALRVTGIQVVPAGAREISVIRTNNVWLLDKPVSYPAQSAPVGELLDALGKLTPVMTFSPGEMNGRKDADAEFGFDNPQYTLDVSAGDQEWHLRVGNKTAPGDGVYVRMVGTPTAYVTDTSWLKFLPHDANDWRDTTLTELPADLDWLVITNGAQAIELRRDATNHLWRMVRPLQTRANNLLIVTALQQLHTARVSQFVSDDPKADLSSYGLDPAALDVWLGSGTNLQTAVHIGKDVADPTGEVYAKREGWNAILSTLKEPLAPWRHEVNDFRDPNLMELTAPVAEIEVSGLDNFTLQSHGTNTWTEVGQKFPVDPFLVTGLIRTLTSLKISEFVQDVPTPAGLQSYGLANPSRQFTLLATPGDTNSVIAQLQFGGTNSNNQIYVKRGDETFVYAMPPDHLSQLTLEGDYYHDRRIWNFSATNVTEVILRQGGKTREIVHHGTNDWTLASGQGIIEPHGVEETVHRLGDLTAMAWMGRKFDPHDVGLNTNNLSLTVELKSGEKYSLDFGRELPVPAMDNIPTALAVVTLEGERWAFVFDPAVYPMVCQWLTIPQKSP